MFSYLEQKRRILGAKCHDIAQHDRLENVAAVAVDDQDVLARDVQEDTTGRILAASSDGLDFELLTTVPNTRSQHVEIGKLAVVLLEVQSLQLLPARKNDCRSTPGSLAPRR